MNISRYALPAAPALFLTLASPCLAAALEDDPIQMRRGIPNMFSLWDAKKPATFKFFTDAETPIEGSRHFDPPEYMKMFHERIRQMYPDQDLGGIMAYIGNGAPGSVYGAHRIIGTHPTEIYVPLSGGRCAIYDFAKSDGKEPEQRLLNAVEGYVRQPWAEVDVVLLYSATPEFVKDYLDGKVPRVIALHEKVAIHYDIPSIDLAKAVARKIKAGELTAEAYFAKRENRESAGNRIDSAEMIRFIEMGFAKRTVGEQAPPRRNYPPVLSKDIMDPAGIYPYEWGKYDRAEWQEGVESVIPLFRHTLVGTKPGAVFSYTFKGSAVGLMDVLAADSADIEVAVDDLPWKRIPAADGAGLETPRQRVLTCLFENLDRTVEHVLKVRVAQNQPPSATPRTVRLCAILNDWHVFSPFEEIRKADTLTWANAIYATMKPIEYTPPADRWKLIPKTMEHLQKGETLRMLMLGDSIMDDSAQSRFDLVVQAMYPGSTVIKLQDGFGGGGCWGMKDNVDHFVVQHQPHLLIIGGISQREDYDAIRSVIRQSKAKIPGLEVLLSTPVMGHVNDPYNKNWTLEIDAEKYAYRANLKKLAEEEGCEFLDLTGVVRKYMLESGKCIGWFMRDGVHANERGSQAIGRHYVEFFRQKK